MLCKRSFLINHLKKNCVLRQRKQDPDGGWWYGYNPGTGEMGFFPASYAEETDVDSHNGLPITMMKTSLKEVVLSSGMYC